MLIAVIGYALTLVLLALVIGFSPILYGLMVQLSRDERHGSIGWWLIGGVVLGIVCMFLLGGAVALAVEVVRATVARGAPVYQLLVGIAGVLLVGYGLRRYFAGSLSMTQSTRHKRLLDRGWLVFLVGFARTVTSISGLAAVMVVSSAIASWSMPMVVALLFVLPLVCVVAVSPFVLLGRVDIARFGPYRAGMSALAGIDRRVRRYRSIMYGAMVCAGAVMVIYACHGWVW